MKFASGVEKSPSIVLGVETAAVIQEDKKKYKFRGLNIYPI